MQDIRAVEISDLRISCDLCNVRFKRFAPGLALVLADKAGKVVFVVDVVAIENKTAVGTEDEVAVGVSHGVEGKLGKHTPGFSAIIADNYFIEKSLFVAGKALVGGVAEFENKYPAVAIYGIINASALVMNLDGIGPGVAVVVAEKTHGCAVGLEISARVAQAEKNDGAIVADNCLFTADKLISVEKRFVAVRKYRGFAPAFSAVSGALILYPAVHGVTCVYTALVARTVGIKADDASVLAFDHGVPKMTASGLGGVVNKKLFFFDHYAGIAFG